MTTPSLAGVTRRRLAGGQGALMLEWGQCFSPSCWARLLHISSCLSLSFSFFLCLLVAWPLISRCDIAWRPEVRPLSRHEETNNRVSLTSLKYLTSSQNSQPSTFSHTPLVQKSGQAPLWNLFDYFSQLQDEKRVLCYIKDLDRAELIYSSSKEEEFALGEYKLHQADLTNLSRVARSQKSKFSCLRKKLSTFIPLPRFISLFFILYLTRILKLK